MRCPCLVSCGNEGRNRPVPGQRHPNKPAATRSPRERKRSRFGHIDRGLDWPDEKLLAEMANWKEELVKAGACPEWGRLQPSSLTETFPSIVSSLGLLNESPSCTMGSQTTTLARKRPQRSQRLLTSRSWTGLSGGWDSFRDI